MTFAGRPERLVEMRKSFACRLVLVAALLASGASQVAAACVVTSPCSRYWSSDVVMIGTVTDITRIRVHTELPGAQFADAERVQLEVVEAFRGAPEGTVTVVNVLHSEAAEFRLGSRYFVYARRNPHDQELHTSLCAGTTAVHLAYEDVRYASWIQTPRTRGRVFGTITHHDSGGGEYVARRLPEDLFVSLSGPGGSYEVRPDRSDSGRFLFDEVLPGTYTLTIHVDGPHDPGDPVEVDVRPPELCQELNLSLRPKGMVRGRVIDAQGRPLPNAPVHVVSGRPPLDFTNFRFEASAVTNDRGEFMFRYLPPGDYTLGMYIDSASKWRRAHAAIYFPGVTDRESTEPVTLPLGSEVDVGDFRLPLAIDKVPVTGIVRLPDGSPCVECAVHMGAEGQDNDAFEADLSARTDGTGRFRLPGIRGRPYRVTAYAQVNDVFFDGQTAVTAGDGEDITVDLKEAR
jgi:hypothetical protein